MSTEPKETVEQKAAREEKETCEIIFYEGQKSSSKFLLRNPRFVQCQENADSMTKLLKESQQPWTLENLERIIQAHPTAFKFAEAAKPPVEQTPARVLPPWGELSIKRLYEMPRDEYRKWLKDPKFIDAVNALRGR